METTLPRCRDRPHPRGQSVSEKHKPPPRPRESTLLSNRRCAPAVGPDQHPQRRRTDRHQRAAPSEPSKQVEQREDSAVVATSEAESDRSVDESPRGRSPARSVQPQGRHRHLQSERRGRVRRCLGTSNRRQDGARRVFHGAWSSDFRDVSSPSQPTRLRLSSLGSLRSNTQFRRSSGHSQTISRSCSGRNERAGVERAVLPHPEGWL
jgi:hypothetical protein